MSEYDPVAEFLGYCKWRCRYLQPKRLREPTLKLAHYLAEHCIPFIRHADDGTWTVNRDTWLEGLRRADLNAWIAYQGVAHSRRRTPPWLVRAARDCAGAVDYWRKKDAQ